jgi:hypothetical protein
MSLVADGYVARFRGATYRLLRTRRIGYSARSVAARASGSLGFVLPD